MWGAAHGRTGGVRGIPSNGSVIWAKERVCVKTSVTEAGRYEAAMDAVDARYDPQDARVDCSAGAAGAAGACYEGLAALYGYGCMLLPSFPA